MTRISWIIASAPVLLALGACGPKSERAETNAQNIAAAETPVEPAAPALTPAELFANTAASSDAFEIATSKLATEKSESSSIQAFAKQMISAHTDSTTKLKAAAASANPPIVPDPTLTADQQARLAALQAKTGAEFDIAYAAEQVAAHQMALDALRAHADSREASQLKDFATSLIPVVTAHLNMAKSLKP